MKEKFFWNIYIPVNSMTKLEGDFYRKLHQYRYYCMNAQKKNIKDFRSTTECINLLNALNLAYEKIKNLAGVEKNELGEYDYPNVSYKVKNIVYKNTSSNVLYCCIADTTMNRMLDIDDILEIIPLYIPGTLRSVPSTKSVVDTVYLECLVNNIQKYFIKYYDSIAEMSNIKLCTDIIQWMDKFPANSISEVNFNSIVAQECIETCIKNIKEEIEKNKEAA